MKSTNYRLIKEIGKGGMATVHLAEDPKFQTEVAVKMLNKEFVHNEHIRKRFVAEARSMYRMSHPNIIKVTDLVDEEDTVAFVMEYIQGETLKEYVDRKGVLPNEEVKSIFSQMLEAVSYVHEQNLVHRDIKPSNFMIDIKGKVKLMDFGIAKNTDQNSSEYTLTGTGMQMGTPMYMSPEQIKSTKEVTAASDIYSLGVVLWQLVTTKKPYEGDTLSTFEIQLKIVQNPLDLTNSSWDAFIQKATAKNEQDRYASCSAWLSELNNGVQDSPVVPKNEATVIERFDATDKTVIEQDLTKDIMLEVSMLAPDGTLKYGFVDVKGNWLIQPMFDSVGYFDEQGLCRATINSKEGCIDKKGNWKIQPIYDDLLQFDDNGYSEAKVNDKVGFIDRSGNWLIQPLFDSVSRFNDQGDCVVQLNGKYGLINNQGAWVIQPFLDGISSYGFDELGYCEASINNKSGFIDRKGNWVIQPIYDSVIDFDENGYGQAFLGEKWGFIDRKGNWVIQPFFEDASGFDSMGYCKVTLNEKVGFIDRKGNWLIQPMFESCGFYSGGFDDYGYCNAVLNENTGVIDRKGNWVIQPKFDGLSDFDEEGFCRAVINEKEGFIDRQGNWLIQPVFDKLYSFRVSDLCLATRDEKSGLIDRKGNWVFQTPFETSSCSKFGDQSYLVEKDSKYGVLDKKGKWIIHPTFIIDSVIGDQIYKVSENNKFGFVDTSGNWIIPPRFDYIYTDIWEDEPFVWNEETKDWDIQSSSESTYPDIDDETIEEYFSDLVGKEKVFLSDNLPANKLKNFIGQFNADFFSEGNALVYYDDTLWGKGDNGFLIYRCQFNRLYLFVSILVGEKMGFCFENDKANPTILSSFYHVKDKKLQLTYQDKEGEEKTLEWFNSNPATLALDTFIQENT